ncbi:CDP-diacylglycerol--glycerol-3-phosphate 3-phosphatidyltransferase [Bifidobacterium margollesii]|uniref:CDP-diacylglycerol--glycerol-3-phosphate 3-phosphatidyltransferase n=1 Tax=Bifidobacterium margollesii TaxID=2020964 RepID=A0A2N5J8E3_9BIFI|nr:CDP-diacylglycerol--glycerol-3-phosphate 3-phosphatidyltransferase [Bifidobacterium margollesii]PLS30489.1 CDP-diacylglycerol--glycerol-3-phosphate 3-phosphatidyltransferase [Bifidobacterium margollesii]
MAEKNNPGEHGGSSLLEGWNTSANLVTYARIILVVVYIVLTVMAGPSGRDDVMLRWIAAVLFIVAASTDKVDGWLARRNNEVTELGKLMDPIADKLLMCSALILLSIFGEFAWAWVITILFLIREIGITVMRFFVMEQPGGKVIAAAWPGKLKTVFQSISLSMYMLPAWSLGATAGRGGLPAMVVDGYYLVAYVLLLVALVLCLYSGFVYVRGTFFRGRTEA